jgi:hypothetical protein
MDWSKKQALGRFEPSQVAETSGSITYAPAMNATRTFQDMVRDVLVKLGLFISQQANASIQSQFACNY